MKKMGWGLGLAAALALVASQAVAQSGSSGSSTGSSSSGSNPSDTTTPQRIDLDAARANLFVTHNRMHDFAYNLGFTEQTWNLQNDNFGKGGKGGDYERGNAQAAAFVTSTLPRFSSGRMAGGTISNRS